MRSVHVPRLEVSVSGIDPATVQAALHALPAALARELAPSRVASGAADHPRAAGGALRFDAPPAAAELTARLAERVAAEVQSRGAALPRGG